MKLAIFGDMHGNDGAAIAAIQWAVDRDVKVAIWAGDCGLWTSLQHVISTDRINAFSLNNGFTNFWVGGNHEHWPTWNQVTAPVSKGGAVKDQWGFSIYRSNIRLAPRVHTWKMGRAWFAGLAGAASIDRRYRTTGVDWFPEETITEAEIASIEKMNTDKFHVNYFITHDAAVNSPFGFSLYEDIPSFDNREKISRAVRHLHPDYHFHGHYHKFLYWDNGGTTTIGLNMEADKNSVVIIDTEDDTVFEFRP